MLLTQLVNFENARIAKASAQGGKQLPFMYQIQNVRWLVRLDAAGNFLSLSPLSGQPVGKKKDMGKPLAAPSVVRSMGVKAKLLMDNAEYVLGLARQAGDKKVVDRHAAFKALVQDCAEQTGSPAVQAVYAFLKQHDPMSFAAELPESFTPDINITFEVNGEMPMDLPEVHTFWTSRFTGENTSGDLINGAQGKLMDREPVKIKGIPGGQTAGMNYISANAAAFESYGLEASQVAPVTIGNAEKYANALNTLLRDDQTSLRIGGVVYIFWTSEGHTPPIRQAFDKPTTFDVFADLSDMSMAEVVSRDPHSRFRGSMTGLFTGAGNDVEASTPLHVAGLSASGSRVVLRRHMQSKVGEAAERIEAFYENQYLSPLGSKDTGLYGIYDLARSLYPKPRPGERVEVRAADANAILAHALEGDPLPQAFLERLHARNRVDGGPNRRRAALTRLTLLSRKEWRMESGGLNVLDKNHPNPAYHLGRYIAIVERIQEVAIPNVNVTVSDRFFGALPSQPYAIFSLLDRDVRPHLRKLSRDPQKKDLGRYFERLLEEIVSHIHIGASGTESQDLSPTFTPTERALYSLGNYHQRAYREPQKPKPAADDSLKGTDHE